MRIRPATTNETLVDRASFLSDIFYETSILSALRLARGYAPSIVGVQYSMVSKDLLHSYVQLPATRALQKPIRSRTSN